MDNTRRIQLTAAHIESPSGLVVDFLINGSEGAGKLWVEHRLESRLFRGHASSNNGFFRQEVMVRIIPVSQTEDLGELNASGLFHPFMLVSLKNSCNEAVRNLHQDLSVVSATEQLCLQLISYDAHCIKEPASYFCSQNEARRVSAAAELGRYLQGLLQQHRVKPSSLSQDSLCFKRSSDDELSVSMLPLVELQDMYTDKDLAQLFVNVAYLCACPIFPELNKKQEEFSAFLDRLHQFVGRYALNLDELEKIIQQEARHSFSLSLEGWQLRALSSLVRLGVTLESFSFFDGRASLSDAIKAFTDQCRVLASDLAKNTKPSAADTMHKVAELTEENKAERREGLLHLLSEFISDPIWLEKAIDEEKAFSSSSVHTISKLENTLPGIEDTLVIGKATVTKHSNTIDHAMKTEELVEETLIIR